MDDKSLAAAVRTLLETTMRGLVAGDATLVRRAAVVPTGEIHDWLVDLTSKQDTYRDGILALLAYPVVAGIPLDITLKTAVPSSRGISQTLDALLNSLQIRCRRDVFQTIAKGSSTFIGRDRDSWNQTLAWAATQADITEIKTAFYFVAGRIAATARNIPLMPRLAVKRLTFQAVSAVFDDLLAVPSGGAYEQFIIAALLDSVTISGRVETKAINAADASAGTAADIQIMDGGGVTDAYEVTANDWRTKLKQALAILEGKQLQRVHIVAKATTIRGVDITAQLQSLEGRTDQDVSVLEVAHEIRSLTHRLRMDGRQSALIRLYDHLRDRQPRDELLSGYVAALVNHGLTETG